MLPPALHRAWAETAAYLLRLPRPDPEGRWARQATGIAAAELGELWLAYTQERSALSARLLATRGRVAAYVLGFHLVNAARAWLVLERATSRLALDTMLGDGPMHVLDLGAGSGAASQAAALQLARGARTVHVELFDQNRSLLEAGQQIVASLDAPLITAAAHRTLLHELRVREGEALASSHGSALVVLSFAWNELHRGPPARERVLQQLRALAALRSPGLLLLLEPANQAPCRRAMELRDALVALGLHALYPCPSSAPCPLLQRPRDWCYSEARWQRPGAQQLVDGVLDVDRSHLAVTGLLFGNRVAMERAAPAPLAGPVVVGRPTRQGTTEVQYLLCHGDRVESRAAGAGTWLERGRVLTSTSPGARRG